MPDVDRKIRISGAAFEHIVGVAAKAAAERAKDAEQTHANEEHRRLHLINKALAEGKNLHDLKQDNLGSRCTRCNKQFSLVLETVGLDDTPVYLQECNVKPPAPQEEVNKLMTEGPGK
jgi:hypothetical protein